MRDSKVSSAGSSRRPRAASDSHSRKQMRSRVTRQQLIEAARCIFARDGFEQARLEDIATAAGKTRGAFYANFEDKEDVFFAIYEEDIDLDMEGIRRLLPPSGGAGQDLEQRIRALAAYMAKLGNDRQRTLLTLEFKVYAIRHPSKRKRLADLHTAMRLRCSFPEIAEFMPEFYRQSTKKQLAGSFATGAILEGLALNRLFDPAALGESQIKYYLALCMREALHAPAPA